jgi:hypothetical protein
VQPSPGQSRGVEEIEARLVGRDTEIAGLHSAYLDTLRMGRAHVVGVVGEAGAGKSRLLYEFTTGWICVRRRLSNDLKGRSVPESHKVRTLRTALRSAWEA